jgi:hypothetical protein
MRASVITIGAGVGYVVARRARGASVTPASVPAVSTAPSTNSMIPIDFDAYDRTNTDPAY